jgi:2,5-diketo-D-gluconate reductase A
MPVASTAMNDWRRTRMDAVELNDSSRMPPIGLGVYLVSDVAECERSVETALRSGYRLIDTAAAYRNERAVGRGIRASGVPREDVFVTTKIWVSDTGYEKTEAAIGRSLERLGTGYIDLLLLHQPFGDVRGSWRALEKAVAAGRVRSIGVSNFRPDDLEKLLPTATIRPAVDQVELHPYFQQRDLRAFLGKHGIAVEAWYPIGHGSKELLTEPVLAELASRYGKSAVQIILRWHVQSGVIAIPKSTNPTHIRQNLDVFDFALTEEEMRRVDALDKNRPTFRIPRWLLSPLARLAPIRALP